MKKRHHHDRPGRNLRRPGQSPGEVVTPVVATNAAPRKPPIASADAVQMMRRQWFNPIRALEPRTLARALDAFEYGDLREAALLWEAIAERDDTIKGVKAKREKAVAQRTWEILTVDDSPEAKRHAEELRYFYNNVTATNSYDRNVRGGFSLLARQMMTAVSFRYAAHHILWQPSAAGLTATFEHIPLAFFENRTGRLRFVPNGYGSDGQDLANGEWLVTVGEGLMVACSIAYVYKRGAMRDLVYYCEKFGMPGVLGRTRAARGSEAGNAMKAAVEAFGNDWAAVLYGDEQDGKIDLIQASGGAGLPMPKLIEQCDRKIAALYRGADLSTMSRGNAGANGASVQGDETELLEMDDAQLLSEALNAQVDPWVVKYQTGADRPLAYIKIVVPPQQDVSLNIKVDDFLLRAGVRLSLADLAERYGRAIAADGEPVATAPQGGNNQPGNDPAQVAANARALEDDPDIGQFLAVARDRYAAAASADLRPLAAAIATALQSSGSEFVAGLQALEDRLPELAEQIFRPGQSEEALAEIIGTALLNGATAANANQS